MKTRFDTLVTVTLVVCAVVTTGLVLRRELTPPTNVQMRRDQKPVLVSHWRDYLSKGVRIGPENAEVQIVEFADFECPFCGSFHRTIKTLRERYPTQVTLTYVHFPLPTHRFAVLAARAAECADEQGRFEAMHDQLFDRQESFGLAPWSDYAMVAGVPDLAAFDACIKRTSNVRRIEEGKELGNNLDIEGTPTLIVNGWKLGRPPSAEELDAMVKAVLAGKSPVSEDEHFAK
ncbi:MAG: thioredoxin domain-containing protein [Nevskia sp.]|nr:thioredoxin domain-containing protein [Nevskia sp.]